MRARDLYAVGMTTTTSTSSAPAPDLKNSNQELDQGPATQEQDTKLSTRERVAELQERTVAFGQKVRSFVRKTPRTIASLGDCRQLVRSSGFVGSSYLAADSAASKNEFVSRIGDARRDAKQCGHWLQLLDDNLEEVSEKIRAELQKEAMELERIFGAIIGKTLSKTA